MPDTDDPGRPRARSGRRVPRRAHRPRPRAHADAVDRRARRRLHAAPASSRGCPFGDRRGVQRRASSATIPTRCCRSRATSSACATRSPSCARRVRNAAGDERCVVGVGARRPHGRRDQLLRRPRRPCRTSTARSASRRSAPATASASSGALHLEPWEAVDRLARLRTGQRRRCASEPRRCRPSRASRSPKRWITTQGRQVTVCDPARSGASAVVFAADGRTAHHTPERGSSRAPAHGPRCIVGVHGLPDDGGRLHEHVPGFDAERFAAHEECFVDGVGRWVASRVGVALLADRDCRVACVPRWCARARLGASTSGRLRRGLLCVARRRLQAAGGTAESASPRRSRRGQARAVRPRTRDAASGRTA